MVNGHNSGKWFGLELVKAVGTGPSDESLFKKFMRSVLAPSNGKVVEIGVGICSCWLEPGIATKGEFEPLIIFGKIFNRQAFEPEVEEQGTGTA